MPNTAIMNREFPENFIVALFGSDEAVADITNGRSEIDIMGSVYSLIASLPDPKQREVIQKHYMEHMSLRAIGESMGGRSPERMRQIEAKAMRLMRHPKRVVCLKQGVMGMIENTSRKYQAEYDELKKATNKEIAELREALDRALNGEAVSIPQVNNTAKASIYRTSINDLDLSVRAFNCLKRAGLEDVEKIVERVKLGELESIRNLGRKSAEEVLLKLIAIGVPASELEVDPAVLEANRAANEARVKLNAAETEERKAKEKALMEAKIEREREACKCIPQIRDAIIANAVDGLTHIFGHGDLLELLRRNIEMFLPNERVVSIIMMTEIMDADSAASPIRDLISKEGLYAFNSTAFAKFMGYRRRVSWERYSYRSAVKRDALVPKDTVLPVIDYSQIYVRELNMSPELKGYLYSMGYVTVAQLIDEFPSGQMANKINDTLDTYYPDTMKAMGYTDVNAVLRAVVVALEQVRVSFNTEELYNGYV